MMARTLADVKVSVDNPTKTLSIRVTEEMYDELEIIRKYEQSSNRVELSRSWILERVSAYKDNPRYLAYRREWERKHPKGQATIA